MSIIKGVVDQAFEISAVTGQRINPITGEPLLGQLMCDLRPEREEAYRAVLAREVFAMENPLLQVQLPLTDSEIDRLKRKGGEYLMIALFAASFKANSWDRRHPDLRDFGGGVLCLSDADLLTLGFKDSEELLDLTGRFSPQPLQGLWRDAIWRPKVGH